MEPVELAPTLRPVLAGGERILCVQNRVGLYQGAARDSEHDNGTVYLTTRRVVYVDQQSPRWRSVAVALGHVRRWSLHGGFLYSSAKVSLHIAPSVTAVCGDGVPGAGPGTPQSAPAADSDAGWRCTICEHANRDGAKCVLCGVPRQADAPDLGPGAASPAQPADVARCPACTFDNHASMERCELCDSELRPATPASAGGSGSTGEAASEASAAET
ncbi:Vacuolar protein-sorting-associated protein 36, partial [Coemansia nantahalensis]